MSQQSYLIDTNILIGLEDYHAVEASYARFHALASAHKVDIYVHEAAKDDIARDKDVERVLPVEFRQRKKPPEGGR